MPRALPKMLETSTRSLSAVKFAEKLFALARALRHAHVLQLQQHLHVWYSADITSLRDEVTNTKPCLCSLPKPACAARCFIA